MIELYAVGQTTHLVCMAVGACNPPRKISGKSLFREVFGKPYRHPTQLHLEPANKTAALHHWRGTVGPAFSYLERLREPVEVGAVIRKRTHKEGRG